ncbi:MAG TPA: DUF4446 family protein [Candidatus Dormibacteraeota bacterium]|nr:DUF4446 family protein [Candidatus Dormibacteraeota bacterium]
MENVNTIWLISGASIATAAFAVWQTIRLRQRFNAAFTTEGGELEKTLAKYFQSVNSTESHLKKLDTLYRQLAESQSLSSQKISIVRFNPFGDTGGDQSFVLAVLDAHDSGYVITSIHSRTGTRVYVKPIDYGKSKHALAEEELKALKQASKRKPHSKEKSDAKKT